MDEQFFTIPQLVEQNAHNFPFWVKPWRVSHSCLLVKSYDIDDKGKLEFIADRYALDKRTVLGKNLMIGAFDQPCWQFA